MSGEVLITYSSYCFGIAFLATVIYLILRKMRSPNVLSVLMDKHPSKSFLMPSNTLKIMAFAFVCYIAIAFTSDVAYTWLASVAVAFLCCSVLVDRMCCILLSRREIKKKSATADLEEDEDISILDEDTIPDFLNIILLICDIIAWTALIDISILLVMDFVEVVIPHYLSVVGL